MCICDFPTGRCNRPAHLSRGKVINGMCRGHRAQKARNEELRPLDDAKAGRRSSWQAVVAVAGRYFESGDDDAKFNWARRHWQELSVRFAREVLKKRGFVIVKRRKT